MNGWTQPVTLCGVTFPQRTALATTATLTLALLAGCGGATATATASASAVPVISNIARPNAACTPAADRKLGAGDDLSSILFFGYIDGEQKEMLVGKALTQALNGHKVEYVWYCPLRSQWH